MNPNFETLLLAAGQVKNITTTASVLTVKTSTLAIQVSFNGGPQQPCASGAKLNITGGNFSLTNNQSVAVTIGFWLGDKSVDFDPADNSASNAATYLFGNCGIANSTAANLPDDSAPGHVTSIACGATGLLTIPNTPNIQIVATNNAHRRQTIIFSISATSANPLNILDPNKNTVMTIPIGSPPIQLVTDSVLYISGAGGSCTVTIGEIYLSN